MSHKVSIKYCGVPKCSNTSMKTAHKFFFSSPDNVIRRKLWLKAMGLSLKYYSEKTRFFVCEDHFDLPNDLRDYGRFLHGKHIFKLHKLKQDVLPHIFNGQDVKNTLEETTARTEFSDHARNSIIEEPPNPLQTELNSSEMQTELTSFEEKSLKTELFIKSEKEDIEIDEKYWPIEPSVKSEKAVTDVTETISNNSNEPSKIFEITLRCDGDITCTCDTGPCDRINTHDKGSQCYFDPIKPKIRSRGIQTSNRCFTRNVALSPIRFDELENENESFGRSRKKSKTSQRANCGASTSKVSKKAKIFSMNDC